MKVKDIMTKNPACATPTTSLRETAKMMVDNDCGCIPVIEDNENQKPVGMITDRDITIRTVADGKNPLEMTVSDVMSSNVITVSDDSTVEECCQLMEENQVRRVAVVDEKGMCCGIVAQADIAIKADDAKTDKVVEKISKSATS